MTDEEKGGGGRERDRETVVRDADEDRHDYAKGGRGREGDRLHGG